MYMYMYVGRCMYLYAYLYVCVFMCACVCLCVLCMCVHTCMYVRASLYTMCIKHVYNHAFVFAGACVHD